MKVMFTSLLIFLLLIHHSSSSSSRRSLHQPFFPVIDSPPPPPPITAQPSPSPQPQLQPKHPFSSQTPPTLNDHRHFFPFYTPPSASTTTTPSISVPTFPANVSSSSIILPPPSSSSSSSSKKLLALSLTLSLLSVAFIAAVLASLLYLRNHNPPTSDSIRLFPPNIPTSTDKPPPSPPTLPPNFSTPNSSEFLYLGTLVSPTPTPHQLPLKTFTNAPLGYKTLGSPELQPLPPLPRHHFPHHRNLDQVDDFFSPKTSPHAKGSTCFVDSTSTAYNRSSVSRMPSYLTSNPASPTHTRRVTLDLGPTSFSSNSPDAAVPIRLSKSPSLPAERYTHNTPMKLPPPPPPMPPPGFWETHVEVPEPTMGPTGAVVSELEPQEKEQRKDEILKPKLKALHWDKVRASSERAMAWDHLKFSSFQLNEEMIETLFTANSSSLAPKHSSINQENRVLDPYKSQNIAILLRAFNLTLDEVCESILQGNVDTLGTELLESLLKMAPTMEEQVRLKEYNDDASPFKLGPAEKFLKAVIDIPFAFKRVDAMLYISNFDTELDYLDRSFETIQSACQQLRNSRMFKKLLEAVLMSGNCMNVGTNRGDAHAFKLDTLLKLVDVKGTDGKTTLLHFVVQEIIRAEGYRLSGMDHDSTAQVNEQSALRDDVELRKAGLEVVYSLGGELSSVKKAAGMDFDMLSKEVRRLGVGMAKIGEVVALNGGSNEIFLDSMNKFLKKAEENIIKIEGQERVTISLVKETMEYFHGNSSAKEEAQPLRIFIVVKDFLGILDQVCKEVGRMNERTTVGSCGQASVFPSFNGKQPFGSSDD